MEENGEQGRRWWAARKRKNPGGNGERRCTESHSPLSPSPSILWLNYSGRKIIQSPLLYRLSLEFYPEICSVGISPGNEEFFYLWTNSNTFDKVESDFSKSVFFPIPLALIAPVADLVTVNENEINEDSAEAEAKRNAPLDSEIVLISSCFVPRRSKQGWIDGYS